MIEVAGLRLTFNAGSPLEMVALKGIDLSIQAGEFVTLIGSNGAGKSSLLNSLAGEVTPGAGRIVMDGQDVTRWPAERRAALVARVFQEPAAGSCAALTVEENLALARARGTPRGLVPALTAPVRETLRERLAALGLGLEGRLTEHMERLSGGQRQAVALLMATLRPSKVLLLDEHTAALDPKVGAAVLELTRRLVDGQGLTTLMVTHSMRQALAVGSRTVMLHEGRVVFDVGGAERARMTVPDLLAMFEKVRREVLDDDSLLLE